ncbi:hypothetical protein CLAIMM_02856 [Cladophialophora immunda]|nr:hypothetical protein CLAIMM_02856 [Cladophialophora immunda]
MCIYYTYHFSCCPGTARPAPYYVHSLCDKASSPKKFPLGAGGVKVMDLKKCKVQHEILDGAEADQPCPKCGTRPENCEQ